MSIAGIRKGLLLSLSIIATIVIAYVIGAFAAGTVAKARYDKLESQRKAEIISKLHDRIEIGKTLPDANFLTLENDVVRLSDVVSRTSLVIYMSPSCPICMTQIDSIMSVTRSQGDVRSFILISSADPYYLEEMKAERNLDIPILCDVDGQYNSTYLGLASVPFNFIVDQSLRIQDLFPGQPKIEMIKEIAGSVK